MAEVSYYSYEYDPDSEPFLADAEGGDHVELPEGGRDVEQKVLLPTDIQLPSLDTKNTPERWYEPLSFFFFLAFNPRFLACFCRVLYLSIDYVNHHSNRSK